MEHLDIQPIFGNAEDGKPIVIAGPCSAETREQTVNTAKALAENGVKYFRAGIWKPRTKPGGFEGVGEKGLQWLKEVKDETGMLICTEVANPVHIEKCLEVGVDMLWIGARTSVNPFAVQELADNLRGIDIPVLVKNPVNPDLELWIGALQRINNAGIKRLAAIHRGFSSFEKKIYRNQPHWHIPIELRRRCPNLPLLCDPSHIGGKRELIPTLSQQAVDLGFDGLIIETHCSPVKAWSDAAQQVTPETLVDIIDNLSLRYNANNTEMLEGLRRQIDECDSSLIEIISRRMKIAREIGLYKKENDIRILQTDRYSEILEKLIHLAKECSINEDFIKDIFELIHEESIKEQMKI